MSAVSLKKALKGDIEQLVLLTELIQTGEIDRNLVKAIRKGDQANLYCIYLGFCLDLFRDGKDPSTILTKIEQLDEPKGFFLNLKGVLYQGELVNLVKQKSIVDMKFLERATSIDNFVLVNRKEYLAPKVRLEEFEKEVTNNQKDFVTKVAELQNKIQACFGDKRRFTNPLLMLHRLMTQDNKDEILKYSPLIYSLLPPLFKKRLYEHIELIFNHYVQHADVQHAAVFYRFARCFEKMKLYSDMSQAFHQAENLDDKGIYQRKLVKTLEKIVNSNTTLFKCVFDYKYLKNGLDTLLNDLNELDQLVASSKVSQTEKIDGFKKDFLKLAVKLKNFEYIYREKSSSFRSKEQQILMGKFEEIEEFLSAIVPQKKADPEPSESVGSRV